MSRSRTSTPPSSTAPAVASNSRGISWSSVVLPAPVLPTIAVVWPGAGGEGDVGQHRVFGARVVEADVAELDLGRVDRPLRPGGRAARTVDSVSSTSWMRPADTDARGIIEIMKVAITTDIRIWMR